MNRFNFRTILLLLLILLCTPTVLAYDFTVDGIYYNKNGTEATVTHDNNFNSYYQGEVLIPETVTYDGTTYTVTCIGNNAFYGCSYLTSVIIPNTVTTIDVEAFRLCTGLSHITIPNSITTIGNSAFISCISLMSMTIPNSVTRIGNKAFQGCRSLIALDFNAVNCADFSTNDNNPFYNLNLSTVNFGDSVKRIPAYFAQNQTKLVHLNIGNSVTSIGDHAFWYCVGLTDVTIPNSVIEIEDRVFHGCKGLKNVTFGSSIICIGDSAFNSCSSLTSVTIPKSIQRIGCRAFNGCTALDTLNFNAISCANFSSDYYRQPFYYLNISTINLGDSVERIPAYFVQGLKKIKNLLIPNSVTSIGECAFQGCSGLAGDLTIPNSVTSIGNYAFYGCSGLTGDLIIPDSILMIDYGVFRDCSGLTSLTFPSMVTNISSYAFQGCSGLTSVTIPNSVTSIGDYAFQGCSGLTNVTIGNSVTSIGGYAFQGCNGLTGDLTIPNSVTSIGNYAFQECSALQTLNFNAVSCDNFSSAARSRPFYNLNISIINIGNEVEKIPDYFANGLTNLTSVSIGNSVITIGNYAFYGCSGLVSVAIPNTVTSIGVYAFYNCSGLTGDLIIPNSVTSIGNYAFYGCSGLTGDLIIPNSITIIDYGVFEGCSGLTSVTFGNSVSEIGSSAFYGCSGLESVTIPYSLTSIGSYAFQGCSALQTLNFNAVSCSDFSSTASSRPFYNLNISTIYFGDNVERIPAYFAHGLVKLTSVTIPKSVNYIGNYAFQGCSYLQTLNFNAVSCSDFSSLVFDGSKNISTVNIGNSVERIPAFFAYGQTKLSSVAIPNSVTTIGKYAFSGCSGLSCVTIPNSVTTIANNAFYSCSGLTGTLTIPTSVTTIGNSAFSGCSSLTSVSSLRPEAVSLPSDAFSSSTYSNAMLKVPVGSYNSYMQTDYWNKFSRICEVDVDDNIMVTGISLNVSDKVLNIGETFGLTATLSPDFATNRTVLWSSSENNVATVDNDGMVTALDDGSAIITATTTDGSNLSASCNVTVVRPVTGITLNENSLELVLPEMAQLIATITPSNPTNGTLQWTSSKSSVARVDANGLVTSVAPGTATITATTNDGTNLSASCSVTVRRQYVTSITLNEIYLEMHLGDTFQLSADVAPENATNKTLNWSSSTTSVASVDTNGLVTAKSAGTAIITARAADGSNISKSCIVNVLPDYYISLDTLTHIRGEAANLVDLPVSLFNKNPISAIQFDVSLPTCVSFGYPEMWLDEDRATRSHSLSINQLSSNSYRVLIASSTAKNLKGNDGPIAHMNILMSKTISTTGNYYINISNIIASESDETQHILNNSKGVVRYYYIVGDADADASVDIADYMATASKILGRSPSPFYSDAADVDANSSINVTDLVGIANISLGIKPITLRYSPRHGSELDCLTCEPLAIVGGGEGEATLNLDAGYDFAAFQMDLSLPQGMTLKDAVLGNEATKLQLTWTTLPDGKVRLLASSFSNAEVMGACPGLLTLKVKTDESFVGSSIGISDITFAERNLNSHKFDDMEVECYGTTAVQEIDGASHIYVEGGMIIVDTPMNGKVVVSDISGHTREYSVSVGRNEIAPWTTGILMIKFNNQTLKINLK